jgi:hypothetical protein
MNRRAAFCVLSIATHALVTTTCFAAELASHTDLVKILRTEDFQLLHHVRQISRGDWKAAGVMPQGRSITALMVDPGKSYQSGDLWDTDKPIRQLLLAPTSRRHDILCFWEGTQGGPCLGVLLLERDVPRSKLIFYAIMNNDISQGSWTWNEVKRHILHNKMDVLISAEHPGVYDNRLP